MKVLLPPSEGKTQPVRGNPLDLGTLSHQDLHPARLQLLDIVAGLSRDNPDEAARALKLSAGQRDLVRLNAEVLTSPSARASRIYTGVLYEAMGLESLDAAAKRRASTWLRVTSALFGLVAPSDRISAYRLSGTTVWPGAGSMAAYWRPHVSATLEKIASRELVVDLRSSGYSGFWNPTSVAQKRVVTLRVLHETNGSRSVVSHFNKATKGRLVRSLLHADPARSPRHFRDLLGDLGWHVEAKDHHFDVIVNDL